jgi:hypothetical protein
MTGWLFALLGAAAGVAQAGLLARSPQGRANPLAFLARFVLVGAVLVLAARAGSLAAATAGWLAGFVAAGAVALRGLR